jgi:maleylacetoacetate isomerase
MTFYGYFRSSAAYRCRIAFNLKGVQPETVFVHLRKTEQHADEYRSRNPQGLVPALEVDGTTLTQSLAIIEWLDETHPEPALLPADPLTRARVRAFAQAIACDVHPLQNLRVLRYLKETLGHEQAALDAWCRHWIGDGLAACEALASRELRGRFLFGDRPGLAEICLVPQMFSAERFGVDVSGLERLKEVTAACAGMPEFAEAHPARQPDAET